MLEYKIVGQDRAAEIAQLAVRLTHEIMEKTGVRHFDVDAPLAEKLCREFIGNGNYTVMAALSGNEIVGFGAICENRSLYAEGVFGTIQEFYVRPEWRSRSVGAGLIRSIVELSRTKKWTRLELCTPPVPEFDKTVSFYRENGFEVTGGYKMKRAIS